MFLNIYLFLKKKYFCAYYFGVEAYSCFTMASSLFCFNCGENSHISMHCTKQQKYSRCSECENVCFTGQAHKENCGNKEFRSKKIVPSNSVVELATILEISFKSAENIFVASSNCDKVIGNASLWLPAINLQLRREKNSLVFVGGEGERTISFVDEKDKHVLKLSIGKFLLINDYYKIWSNGCVQYNRNHMQNSFGRSSCTIKVQAEYVMCARIKWNGMTYFIDIYPDGVVLKDPFEKYRKKFISNHYFITFF